jgi:two-component system, NarL family, sensor kinase
MIFRIVQELLNNAIKHSQAERIIVKITVGPRLTVVVEDNGVGYDPDVFRKDAQKSGRGLGLFNIENRARLLGAKLEFVKDVSRGSRTVITLPLSHEQKT